MHMACFSCVSAINWLLLHNHSHRRRSSHRFEQMSSDLTISSLSSTACNLAAVQAAWTTVWRGGEFPNPAGVSLRLDTRTQPAHRWRLVLADLWSCVLLRRPVLSISSLAESGISTLAPIPSPSFSRTLPSSFIPSSSSTSSSSSASNSSYSSLPLSTTSTLASSFASTQCRSPMAYSVSVRSEAHSQPTQAPHQSDVPFSGSSVLSGRHSLDIELEGDEPFLLPDDFIWIAQVSNIC
ncbi:unnamed protein product [Protopolystoma xenopodis]|uniref:Uncharacterized protein n=1 Tax=Protopolystoma xenopodis TaxID=117903 RepID=A0A3S5AZD5_9PLAT|nr:unnamed protein product [Protopolystoma xenopodis]